MRWLVFAALLAGCGDVSTAGGVGTGGSSAGSSGQAGAPGGGSGGTGGMVVTGGTGGTIVDAGLSCAIPADQVSGTSMAVRSTNNSDQLHNIDCRSSMLTVQIIQGTYYDSTWTLSHYAASPSATAGYCDVSFEFTRTTTACGSEFLEAPLTIPGI